MEALRAEALQSVMSRVEDRNFGGLRENMSWTSKLKPGRMALVGVAVIAGGMAAFLALQRETPAPTPVVAEPIPQVVEVPRTRILVAAEQIGAGQRVTASSFTWQEWPQDALRPEFISDESAPDAIGAFEGSVASQDIFEGEPIREQKLAAPSTAQLSAALSPGMRAVSVSVSAESASGGFITPNDRVDVVLTRALATTQTTHTILSAVRVLAINANRGDRASTGETEGEKEEPGVFSSAIATLELDQGQAEMIINARTMGQLSLVLVPMSDFADAANPDRRAINQAIRMTSQFWAN